jgi:SNF2 family DNA or RNA helicase
MGLGEEIYYVIIFSLICFIGKTVQVITRITEGKRTAEEKAKGYSRPTLIIVGLTILPQWKEECHKFSPSLRVVVHHGTNRTRSGLARRRNTHIS